MGEVGTHYKQSTIFVVLVLLAILTGISAGILYTIDRRTAPVTHEATSASFTKPAVLGMTTVIRFAAQPGKTVLEQLQAREKVVVNQDPQYDAFVESINGLKNGTDNKYWSFYVNGQITNIGAGNYRTKAGDVITWKFE